VKNLLVFAAPIAGNSLHSHFLNVLQVLAIFCASSSLGYVFNDWNDRELDAENPKKKLRPFASGILRRLDAYTIMVLLSSLIVVLLYFNKSFIIVTLVYLVLTLSYTKWLKRVAVVDLIVVASCFVMRAVAGGVASGSPLSKWFFLVISFGALLIISGKRLAELLQGGVTRKVVEEYSESFLRILMGIGVSGALFGFALWAFTQPKNMIYAQASFAPFAVCVLRLYWILDKGKSHLSEDFPAKDPVLLIASLCLAANLLFVVYT
jgi:decaprenyl-phosphate phosphoribosyltransferase